MPSSALAEHALRALVGRTKNASAAPVGRAEVDAVEADEMIDADAVEERGGAPGRARIHGKPLAAITSQRHGGRPQSWPVSLNASGGTPTRGVEHELVLARPHVGAVAPTP